MLHRILNLPVGATNVNVEENLSRRLSRRSSNNCNDRRNGSDTELRSMTWKQPLYPTPKLFKANRSVGKIMGSLFCNSKEMVMTEYLDDNSSVYGHVVGIVAIRNADFEILVHPPYSPDFLSTGFCLFPELKKCLEGQRFEDDEAAVAEAQEFLGAHDEELIKKGILSLDKRYAKCILLKGDYVRK
ncbi:Histone-lysine N-methyltransferase SETMAR [Eumeta japonica]|uniref:Histone-lysine N-methyltransferase SETMAR n=1 Tax=Eumeta variegata TaxID=151549 RepID=A0A4C1ZIU1_EUMVA|nr:Histone-lysine N-methyltransferase SETMAR [Eumeta japonica]